jgi:hypothetical protein
VVRPKKRWKGNSAGTDLKALEACALRMMMIMIIMNTI